MMTISVPHRGHAEEAPPLPVAFLDRPRDFLSMERRNGYPGRQLINPQPGQTLTNLVKRDETLLSFVPKHQPTHLKLWTKVSRPMALSSG